jgi:hypothetical protein
VLSAECRVLSEDISDLTSDFWGIYNCVLLTVLSSKYYRQL